MDRCKPGRNAGIPRQHILLDKQFCDGRSGLLTSTLLSSIGQDLVISQQRVPCVEDQSRLRARGIRSDLLMKQSYPVAIHMFRIFQIRNVRPVFIILLVNAQLATAVVYYCLEKNLNVS